MKRNKIWMLRKNEQSISINFYDLNEKTLVWKHFANLTTKDMNGVFNEAKKNNEWKFLNSNKNQIWGDKGENVWEWKKRSFERVHIFSCCFLLVKRQQTINS